MSVSVLERHVFSKPFFDRQGFILALQDGKLVVFVHAGFGPNEQLSDISMDDLRNSRAGTVFVVTFRS